MSAIDEISLEAKLAQNMCRCCLVEAGCKDFSTEYYPAGKREVYEEMLKETFNIVISEASRGSQLICESCVTRLRDAASFRRMVLHSEMLLQHVDGKYNYDNEEINAVVEQTLPAPRSEHAAGDARDRLGVDCSALPSPPAQESPVSAKNTKFSSGKQAKLRRKGQKTEVPSPQRIRVSSSRGPGPLRRAASARLLSSSTALPFQWHGRLRCFSCSLPLPLPLLRPHASTHTLQEILAKVISLQNRPLKVDISDLRCLKCDGKINSLADLRLHLVEAHGEDFESEDDLLVPFRLADEQLKCQLCGEEHRTFRLLNMHMNRHDSRHICHVCGAAFANLVFLNLHHTRSHRKIKCKPCALEFESKAEKRRHDISEHGFKLQKLRYPCNQCEERFSQERLRIIHSSKAHGVAEPRHACGQCERHFITAALRNEHVVRHGRRGGGGEGRSARMRGGCIPESRDRYTLLGVVRGD